ncbi:MAG: uroporphyrinogen-III C-methyltransferase, partial [Acidiferrobacterales bacterium]|nr:uroporphyrinogen-III C-methyltransferase [Acidiferrobacterales bacterium]
NQTSEIGKPAVQTVEKKSGSGLSVVAILLSLAAIGVTGYTWYKIDVLDAQSNTKLAVGMQDIAGQVTRISDSVSVLQSSHSNSVSKEQLTTRLLETQVSVDKQFEKLQSGQQGLSESILKISTDLQKGANEYVVDEVSQLLKLANNNVIFSNNIEAAINAFSLADTQLKELASPRFSEVRRKINDEIELLRAVELVDIESTLAKLNAISANIESLPLENEPPVIEEDAQSSSEGVTEEITWRTELRKMWGDIIGSFNIQRVGKAPKPLLAPSERYFLDQNLKLALSKAEIALLQDRQALYISSVSEANDWLNEYFDLNDDRVKDAVSQLNKLKTVEFSQELPSVAGSYELLQSIKGGQ